MKKYLYLIAALAIVAVSCKKEEPVTPSITLSTPAEVTVVTDGGIETVSFTSNVAWTASVDNSNWSVTPTSGEAGEATVKVTALNNTTEDPIVVKLTIKADSASQTVTFTQLQKDAMVADQKSYTVPAEGGQVSVKVNANVEVTATTDVDWITIPTPTKAMVEKTFDLTVEANKGEAREAAVILSGAGIKAEVIISQDAYVPTFELDCEQFVVAKDGGEFTITVNANVDFTITDYSDGSFPWQHAVLSDDKKTVTVTIDANNDYSARESYVKFKTSEIQVPVLDSETGEPTGEMEDLVIRVYFTQEGLTKIVWVANLPDAMIGGVQLSIAKVADKYVIFDGASAPVSFDSATGEISDASSLVSVPDVEISEIFNDDAGNLLIATPAAYGEPFDVFAIPAGSADASQARNVVHAYFDYYGYGLGHFQAKGDVFADGIITALIADGPSAGVPVTGVYWEINDGEAAWAPYGDTGETASQFEYVTFTVGTDVWLTNRAAFAPLGTSAASGFLYNGYDGTYALQLHVGGSASSLTTIGDWANGVSSINAGLWGDKPVVVVNNMAWFPYWAMPSVLTIFDASTMSQITSVNILQEGLEATFMAEPSTCTLLEQDGSNLVIYSVDGAQGLVQKIVIPEK